MTLRTIYNKQNFDYSKNPMFFGSTLGVTREDRVKYPELIDFKHLQRGLIWQAEDINLTQDKLDYENKLTNDEKFIFDSNLKYQTTLDTIQTRAITQVLAPHVTLPELEGFLPWWAAFEDLHSDSYQYMLRQVYADPTPVLDEIYDNPSINSRMSTMINYYDDLLNTKEVEKERNLLLLLYSVNALEAIRFYVSFVCTFAFDRANLMRGSANIIRYIARDESIHYKAITFIINQLQNGNEGEDWKALCLETKQDAVDIFQQVLKEETAWIDYLFQQGEPDFLSKVLLKEKLNWYTARTMQNLKLPVNFDYPKVNPISWVEDIYLNFSGVQGANQDNNNTSYMNDITVDDLTVEKLDSLRTYYNS